MRLYEANIRVPDSDSDTLEEDRHPNRFFSPESPVTHPRKRYVKKHRIEYEESQRNNIKPSSYIKTQPIIK